MRVTITKRLFLFQKDGRKIRFDVYDCRICILAVSIANVLIEPSRWIISSHCRTACNNTFICHKTDHTPRAPLTRSVDLSPSTVPLRPVNHSTLESGDLFWRFGFTSHSDRKWDVVAYDIEGLMHRRCISLLWDGNEMERRGGEGRGWIGYVFVGYRAISGIRFCFTVKREYRRRRFIDCRSAKDFTVSGRGAYGIFRQCRDGIGST